MPLQPLELYNLKSGDPSQLDRVLRAQNVPPAIIRNMCSDDFDSIQGYFFNQQQWPQGDLVQQGDDALLPQALQGVV